MKCFPTIVNLNASKDGQKIRNRVLLLKDLLCYHMNGYIYRNKSNEKLPAYSVTS